MGYENPSSSVAVRVYAMLPAPKASKMLSLELSIAKGRRGILEDGFNDRLYLCITCMCVYM